MSVAFRSYGQFAVANKTWAVVPKQHCPNPYAAASVSAAANVSAAGYAYAAASVSANANAVAAANAASVGANATVDWCVMWIDRLVLAQLLIGLFYYLSPCGFWCL